MREIDSKGTRILAVTAEKAAHPPPSRRPIEHGLDSRMCCLSAFWGDGSDGGHGTARPRATGDEGRRKWKKRRQEKGMFYETEKNTVASKFFCNRKRKIVSNCGTAPSNAGAGRSCPRQCLLGRAPPSVATFTTCLPHPMSKALCDRRCKREKNDGAEPHQLAPMAWERSTIRTRKSCRTMVQGWLKPLRRFSVNIGSPLEHSS